MDKRPRKKKRDLNELAKAVVDNATDQETPADDTEEPTDKNPPKNPKAVKSGRLGGLKGGRSRANRLSAEERHRIAQNAALTRWRKSSK